MTDTTKSTFIRTLVVCALGYFIDVFDIQLFAVLRVASLTEMGVPTDQLAKVGGHILNAQMAGMVLGAFLWGWLGDKHGRLKALYGSILIYSLGTFACAFAHDPTTYGLLRFITGFGLAGETGAAITLIAEMMPRDKRGWGVAIIAGFGFLGPAAAVIASWFMSWHQMYIGAGLLGLGLLVLRLRLTEADLYAKTHSSNIMRGSLKLLSHPQTAISLFWCFIIGCACIYSWSLLNFFSIELGHAVLGDTVVFDQKTTLLAFFVGASCGDFLSGIISQLCGNRRRIMAVFFAASAFLSLPYLIMGNNIGLGKTGFYVLYFFLGIAAGNWVLLATVAAEHFGTNIRATTAILLTNLARGFTIPMLLVFQSLRSFMPITTAAAVIGAILYLLAFFAISRLRETHGLDLDYVETLKS